MNGTVQVNGGDSNFWGRRSAAAALSLVAHAGVLTFWLVTPALPVPASSPQVVSVSLIQAAPAAPAVPPAPAAAPPRQAARPRLVPPPRPVPQTAGPVEAAEPLSAAAALPAPAEMVAAVAAAGAEAAEELLVEPSYQADYLRNPAPGYPRLSKRLGEQGEVLLRVLVDPEGKARRVELDRSSGFERLDRAAHEVVQQWSFVPARRGGRAVEAWVIVPILFRLG